MIFFPAKAVSTGTVSDSPMDEFQMSPIRRIVNAVPERPETKLR
jgi:hypothetical protein